METESRFWANDDLLHSIKNIQSLQIETTDYCNRKCGFCPNSYLQKTRDRVMTEETFGRILGELEAIRYDGRIHLYGSGEPLFDNRIVDNIARARERFPSAYLYLSTNGDLLDVEISVKELFDAGLTALSVMLYDEQNKERLKKYEAYPAIALIYPEKINEANLWFNRGGNIDVGSSREFDFCELPLQRLFFNWKGEMILCCADFKHEIVMGDINEKPLMDIWLSPKYKIYRIAHFLRRGFELDLCSKCNRIKGDCANVLSPKGGSENG